jgi:hypothetical protein
MASEPDIELRRLRAHRFPDHYANRAGATSRFVSQASTTDQASESIEAGLTKHASSILRGSDYTVQDTSEIAFSSNDKSPLISQQPVNSSEAKVDNEDNDVRTPTRKSRASVPWPLRRLSLLGLIAFLVALIVALEVLHYSSNKNQGLVTADQDAAYLWKYLPTASEIIEPR